jgi:hypothetical protein
LNRAGGALALLLAVPLALSCNGEAQQFKPGEIPPDLDTDTDGVPDVSEDRDQDGIVDPGETDPRNTDSDADGIPDDGEVEYLACARVNDRPIAVYDAPGTDSMLLVDKTVDQHSMVRTSDNRAPGLVVADGTLNVTAAMVSKRPGNGVRSPAAQRDLERRTGLAMLGELGALSSRAFVTHDGFEAEQASFTLTFAQAVDVRTAANRIAGALLGGVPLTGTLPAGGTSERVMSVRLLTILRSQTRVVMVAAIAPGAQPADAQLIRLEELTDGTNVARHGAFTRHVCDELKAVAQSKGDFIFVIDDSGSMQDDQEAVRAAGSAMAEVLQAAQLDFRLGVVRHRAQENQNSPQRGRLEGDGLTADLTEFQNTVVVGAEGGWEPGLETGLLAIDRLLPRTLETEPVDPQRLRDGAATIIIHLSDERDQAIECEACGACGQEPMPRNQLCTGGDPQQVIDRFVADYRSRNAVNFAIVGDLPTGCRQPGARDDFEPGQGYVEVANATGGQFGSLCGDMSQNLRDIARVATGVASAYRLSTQPASASIKVAIGPPGQGRVIPRSRTNGYDYDAVQNSIIFYGDARPADGHEVVIGYRRWDFANDPTTPPDGCDACAQYTSCNPTSDLVLCEPVCGDIVCQGGQACILDSASCGDPNQIPPPPNEACGACDPGLVCDPSAQSCVPPCESSGCSGNQICNTGTHLCETPDF